MSQNTGIIDNTCSSSSPVWHVRVRAIDRAIFVWPWKMVSVSVRYYLFCQPINVKIKTWSLRFPAKENPNMEKIGQLCCSMTSKRSIDWFLESTSGVKCFHSSVRLTNQKPRAFVSVRWTNQIALSALFPLVCCFCFVRAFSFQGHTKIEVQAHFSMIQAWTTYPGVKASKCFLPFLSLFCNSWVIKTTTKECKMPKN